VFRCLTSHACVRVRASGYMFTCLTSHACVRVRASGYVCSCLTSHACVRVRVRASGYVYTCLISHACVRVRASGYVCTCLTSHACVRVRASGYVCTCLTSHACMRVCACACKCLRVYVRAHKACMDVRTHKRVCDIVSVTHVFVQDTGYTMLKAHFLRVSKYVCCSPLVHCLATEPLCESAIVCVCMCTHNRDYFTPPQLNHTITTESHHHN